MGYNEEYKQKLKTPEEAVKVVKSGDWVDYSLIAGFPQLLDAALAARKEELEDVKIRGYLISDPIQAVECDPERKHFIYNSWYCSGYERKLSDRGLCNFAPMTFRNLASYYERYLDVNVAMMAVPPMDKHGYFNFSTNNPSALATLSKADVVILEVNEHLPRVHGVDANIHISEVDMVVEGHHDPMREYPSPAPGELDSKIADFIVNEMVDGSCIQLGIGGIPNSVGEKIANSDLKDLGIHTELLVDSYLNMYEAGKITNKAKAINRGIGVFGCAMGKQSLYDWLDDNPGMQTYPISYVNCPEVMAQIDNFISINSCISVDLYGQICAESAGTRHISGSGGQLDFITGAYMSNGGKSFICMTSTFKDKQGNLKSRFTPTFNGDTITDPKSQAFYLVTEYGLVNLAGRSNWERAELMIGIAHPEHREDLIKSAEKLGLWVKSNKR